MLWAFLSHGNLNLTSRILNWSAKENPFVVRLFTIGKGVGTVALESEEVEGRWDSELE
jgi:hypothetical protein